MITKTHSKPRSEALLWVSYFLIGLVIAFGSQSVSEWTQTWAKSYCIQK